jgi:Na+/phosphate symporter
MFERIFGTAPQSTLIEAAFDDISSMLEQGRRMMSLAVSSLLGNQPLQVDLDQLDDRLDDSERMVRRTVLEHLAVNPQQDLVASLVLVSMVQDAERLGDFANGLVELTKLARSPRTGPFADRLQALVDRVDPQFVACDSSFRADDVEVARKVMSTHAVLRGEFSRYVADVAASDLSPDMAVVFAGAASMVRRISAHLANIASSVVLPYDQIRHGDEDT